MSEMSKGWIEQSFMDVLDIQGGSQPPKSKFVFEEKEGYVRFLQIRDFGAKPHLTFIPISKSNKLCVEDDILIARYGASIGRICTGMNGAYNVAMAKVIIPDNVYKKYVYYLLKSHIFQSVILGIERSAQDGFNKDDLKKIMLPFPPTIDEQHQIVERLEQLLVKLSAANARLDKIPALLNRFRQSVLLAACSGRLTADWRNGKELPNWKENTLSDVCANIVDCPHSTPKWTQDGKLCVRTTNFKAGHLDLSEKRYVSEETFNCRIMRLKPQSGDILYSREGGILGIACIIPENVELCLGQRMMLMRVDENSNSRYVMFVLNSPLILDIVNQKIAGSASPHINVGDIKKFPVPTPPLPEQEEIVHRVDALFTIADSIEARYNSARQNLARAERAVYAKAFRGELAI